MSESWVVIEREFLERVRSRSFLISTLLFPLLIVGLSIAPVLMGAGGRVERRIALVDEAPAGIGAQVESLLRAAPASPKAPTFTVERVPGPFARARAELARRVVAKEIDGYLYLPPDLLTRNELELRASNVSNFSVLEAVNNAASRAVQLYRLREAGIEPARLAALAREVDLKALRITERGEEGGSAESTFIVAYLLGFLMYMMLIIYGVNVMRSVLEEKTNRISEVLVSSIRAGPLMLGKIIGVGAVALLQIGIWVAFLALLGTQTPLLARRFDLPPGALDGLKIEPSVALLLLAFFLLGFFLYSALFAALGAAMNSEQEAQQFQFFVLLPLIVPLVFFARIAAEPLGQLATTLGLIPFTAPLANAMRMGAATVPPLQIAASLVGMLVTLLAVTWLAGKIYRVGILSTGKRPTLRELGRWVRAA